MPAVTSFTLLPVSWRHASPLFFVCRLPHQLLHRAALHTGFGPPLGYSRQNHWNGMDGDRGVAGNCNVGLGCSLVLYIGPLRERCEWYVVVIFTFKLVFRPCELCVNLVDVESLGGTREC